MNRLVLVCLAVLPLAFHARADAWLHRAEIKLEPPDDGKQIVTVRLTPAHTAPYDLVEFECVYRQEIPWRDPQGRPQTKIIEPVTFTYRRKDVNLTQDLDFYCSFHAPISVARLTAAYGDRTFADGYPVRISAVRLRALKNGTPAWSYTFTAPGVHGVEAPPPSSPPPKPPAGAAFGEVDLS